MAVSFGSLGRLILERDPLGRHGAAVVGRHVKSFNDSELETQPVEQPADRRDPAVDQIHPLVRLARVGRMQVAAKTGAPDAGSGNGPARSRE